MTGRSVFFACHSRWDDSIDFHSSLTEKPSEGKLLWSLRLLAMWRETKWGWFLSFLYSSPGNISSHPFLVFSSGVDKVVFLDTGLAPQQPSHFPVRAEELLWSDTCSVWSRLQWPQPNCDYTDILLFALAVEKCWVMYTQWWQRHSYMCFIVLQYLSFHGYHRNCRFAIQIGRRDSEHQPICYSLLNLILLSWAQTCFSLRGSSVGIHWVHQVFATARLLLGKLGAHTRLPPCTTLRCQVFEQGRWSAFWCTAKVPGGSFLPSGWLFCHSPGVK